MLYIDDDNFSRHRITDERYSGYKLGVKNFSIKCALWCLSSKVNILLKIPKFVYFFIAKIPNGIMGRNRLFEKFW